MTARKHKPVSSLMPSDDGFEPEAASSMCREKRAMDKGLNK
ncbi:hypothetical protein RUM4293_03452 [Ruegeria atlantica]|uniref:Uncharacterized protein n=1 Tax=Ruegeria atlantica TaxID=81569 RepID=A0A0P1EPL8_9RHOB|nr:hypothetical protein RUM4293_03452 [Ruegeria atlantica]